MFYLTVWEKSNVGQDNYQALMRMSICADFKWQSSPQFQIESTLVVDVIRNKSGET